MQGQNPDVRNSEGMPKRTNKMVALLTEKGADLNMKDNTGANAVLYAGITAT